MSTLGAEMHGVRPGYVEIAMPATWMSGAAEDQIGVGLWVGKPDGTRVHEMGSSAHARGSRVVLAQNIQDRHGGDPNYVGASIPAETAAIRLEIMFCSDDQSLSVYYDGDNRVDTQPIDAAGIFDWGVGPVFDVGMIGFAEGLSATSDFPYLANWEVFER